MIYLESGQIMSYILQIKMKAMVMYYNELVYCKNTVIPYNTASFNLFTQKKNTFSKPNNKTEPIF